MTHIGMDQQHSNNGTLSGRGLAICKDPNKDVKQAMASKQGLKSPCLASGECISEHNKERL